MQKWKCDTQPHGWKMREKSVWKTLMVQKKWLVSEGHQRLSYISLFYRSRLPQTLRSNWETECVRTCRCHSERCCASLSRLVFYLAGRMLTPRLQACNVSLRVLEVTQNTNRFGWTTWTRRHRAVWRLSTASFVCVTRNVVARRFSTFFISRTTP